MKKAWMTKLEKDAEDFHRMNPEVLALFNRYAQEAIHAGRKRIGAKAIWERLRWETTVHTIDKTALKLNNNYVSYFARKWIALYPEHENLFATRKVKGDCYLQL